VQQVTNPQDQPCRWFWHGSCPIGIPLCDIEQAQLKFLSECSREALIKAYQLKGSKKGNCRMYARVTTFAIVPAKVDEALDVADTSVFPALQQQRGFKGMLKLFDRQTGKAVAVTLWETEADLKAGESDGFYQQQIAKFASFVSAPPTRETFEATLEM
jgi:heme-degrading monooxygenase HmoA